MTDAFVQQNIALYTSKQPKIFAFGYLYFMGFLTKISLIAVITCHNNSQLHLNSSNAFFSHENYCSPDISHVSKTNYKLMQYLTTFYWCYLR